jgi:hypothetical protein
MAGAKILNHLKRDELIYEPVAPDLLLLITPSIRFP